MLPGVTSIPLFPIVPVSAATNGVSVSVCSNSVVWLLNSHVILGTGAPTDLQQMFALPPSGITTVEILRDVVLASTVKLEKHIMSELVHETNAVPGAITPNSTTGGVMI